MQLAEIAEMHRSFGVFQEWSDAPRRRRIISDLIFSFFCTCAELAVVSRQKDKGNKVRYFPPGRRKIVIFIRN
jgi:hypothetical protein